MNLEPWIDRAVRAVDESIRAEFAEAPETTLRTRFDLQVQAMEGLSEERGDGGFCDGMSYLQDGVVLYAPTPNSRRQNFTMAHELGHWIVERDEGLFNWIADQDNAAVLLESVCDRIAQRLLLPDALVTQVLDGAAVRASHVARLFEVSNASWPACAIALARRLRGLAAIVLVTREDGLVHHASVQPDPDDGWPTIFPWRGQVLDAGHALMNIAPGSAFTRRISWRAPWGSQAEFFADGFADNRRIVGVLVAQDVWGVEPGRVLQPREFDTRPMGKIFCCGQDRLVRGYPCGKCGQQFCPVCKKCQCDRNAASEVLCTECFLLKNAMLVIEGVCDECRR